MPKESEKDSKPRPEMTAEEAKKAREDAIGNKDALIEQTLEEQTLPVSLTADERLALGEEMAQSLAEVETLGEKKEAMAKEYKASIDKATNKANDAARQLRIGKKEAPVQVQVTRDYRLGWIRVKRLDDETEVSTRPMTADERQTGLQFGGSE